MPQAIYPITMPKWGIEMTEGTITAWTAREGQRLERGDPLLEVETEKIVNSVESPAGGTLRRIVASPGETRAVGSLIAVLAESDVPDADIDAFVRSFRGATVSFEPDAAALAAPGHEAPAAPSAEEAGDLRVSPIARRMAERLGIDLSQVKGTGRNGRISKEDVEAYAARASSAGAARSSTSDAEAENPATRTKMSATRATIARRLLESKQSVPHYRLAIDVEADALLARKRELADPSGGGPSLNDFIVRACALALVRHAALNARLEGDEIVQFAHADIALAVATQDGLMAPVVRRADTKLLAEIALETRELAERARRGALTRAEITGGTFTVSNLGMYGVERFDAIVNPPQVAILAVGAVGERVVARGGSPAVAHVMTLTLSADHRVVDGATAAAFLATLRGLLLTPADL